MSTEERNEERFNASVHHGNKMRQKGEARNKRRNVRNELRKITDLGCAYLEDNVVFFDKLTNEN